MLSHKELHRIINIRMKIAKEAFGSGENRSIL